MVKISRAIYWMAVGAWLTFELALAFDKNDGGAMPMAFMLMAVCGVGGLIVFVLLYVLIQKLWPELTLDEQLAKRWSK